MRPACPSCEIERNYVVDSRTIVRFGRYHRTSDSKDVKRYRCLICKKTFSQASRDPFFGQKKRQKNMILAELLASGVSQRRSARILRIHRKTVAFRIKFLGHFFRQKTLVENATLKVTELQFDDLETFEHTKYKPVSVTLAVEGSSRRILGFRVASMTEKGILASKARKKYGKRRDERAQKRRELFQELAPIVEGDAVIK